MNIPVLADDWVTASARCPKHMAHGPCAGVRADGSCEVAAAGRCPYLDVPDRDWPYLETAIAAPLNTVPLNIGPKPEPCSPAAADFLAKAAARPVVVADLVTPALSADGIRAGAAEVAGFADACLTGDHPGARVQFPPSYRARLLTGEGVPAWVGINCRDRNRVALEGELAACADAGAVGVHCVTGDHPSAGYLSDAAHDRDAEDRSVGGHHRVTTAIFDLDSLGLVALARSVAGTMSGGAMGGAGLFSVAHAPAAPPTGKRLARLLAKIGAGADVVFVDHCGGVRPAAAAVSALRAAGFGGIVLCCIPVVTSAGAAEVIASFAADRLPRGYLDAITSAPDPMTSGLAAAANLAQAMLEVPGVNGVNLSSGAAPGQEVATMRALAEVSRRVLGTATALPAQTALPARTARSARSAGQAS